MEKVIFSCLFVILIVYIGIFLQKARRIKLDNTSIDFFKCYITHVHGNLNSIKKEVGMKWYLHNIPDKDIHDIYVITDQKGKYIHAEIGYFNMHHTQLYYFLQDSNIKYYSYGHSGEDYGLGAKEYAAGYLTAEDAHKVLSYMQSYKQLYNINNTVMYIHKYV